MTDLDAKIESLVMEIAEGRTANADNFELLMQHIEQAVITMTNVASPPPPDKAEIYAALAKAQASIQNAQQDETAEVQMKKGGKFSYSYATLASVLDAVRGPLSENGIALFQITEDPGQGVLGIRTVLAHESGQTISDVITMAIESHDPRGIGSIRTYMRRYAVLAICGIAGATDDDAEAATPDIANYDRISTQEAEAIIVKADELFGERADAALAKMLNRLFGGIERVGDIKAGEAEVAVTNLENAAQLMAATAAKKETTAAALAKKEKDAKAEHDEKAPPKTRQPGEDDDK